MLGGLPAGGADASGAAETQEGAADAVTGDGVEIDVGTVAPTKKLLQHHNLKSYKMAVARQLSKTGQNR